MEKIMNKEVGVRCECGCNKFSVMRVVYDAEDEFVSILWESDYLKNETNRLKALWNCIRGKETTYAETLVDRERAIKFFEEVIEMLKENPLTKQE